MRNVSAVSSDKYIFTDVTDLDITDADALDRVVISNNVDGVVNCAVYINVGKAKED